MMIGSLAMMLIALPADDADDPLVLEADQPMGFDDDRFIHGWCWWSNFILKGADDHTRIGSE